MKLTYKDGKAELIHHDKSKVLKMDVRGEVDLKGVVNLRRLLDKAEMLMRECPELEPCPACGSKEASVRLSGMFYEVACDCGRHGYHGMTAAEAIQYWNIEAKDLRERRAKE